MKKILSSLLVGTLVFSSLSSMAVASDTSNYVLVDGNRHQILSENLFHNGDFSDYSGEGMDQWYVGVNTTGHPTNDNYQIPKIDHDGTLHNLTRLTSDGLLQTGGTEIKVTNTFYFGKDTNGTYLAENVGSPWESCAWNGAHSLLAFVPIKPNTKYYFRHRAFTSKYSTSIRYGAINMESYVPSEYTTTGSLTFSGDGYSDCKNGDQQNAGGSWAEYTSIINSGDGDYFLFNAYWLQMAEYLCLDDFELYEISNEPMPYGECYKASIEQTGDLEGMSISGDVLTIDNREYTLWETLLYPNGNANEITSFTAAIKDGPSKTFTLNTTVEGGASAQLLLLINRTDIESIEITPHQ